MKGILRRNDSAQTVPEAVALWVEPPGGVSVGAGAVYVYFVQLPIISSTSDRLKRSGGA